jgi:hypothetical protein
MKKSILIIAFIVSAFYSCSNTESVDESKTIDINQLVGTWNLQSAKLNGEVVSSSYKVQFTSGKRAKFYYRNPTSNTTYGPDIIDQGNYTATGTSLNITWDKSDVGLEVGRYTIQELTSSQLQLKSVITGEGTLTETYIK